MPAEEYKLTTNTTSFTVKATGPGFIVLTEAYERNNFHATLNGDRVPYIRVNHAFKGDSCRLLAGTYRVEFEYYPRGLEERSPGCPRPGVVLVALAAAYADRHPGRAGSRPKGRRSSPGGACSGPR